MDNTPATTTNKTMTDPSAAPSSGVLEPQSQSSGAPQRRSSVGKIVDAIKKPFHKEKKEENVPPAPKESIEQMEQRN